MWAEMCEQKTSWQPHKSGKQLCALTGRGGIMALRTYSGKMVCLSHREMENGKLTLVNGALGVGTIKSGKKKTVFLMEAASDR